MTKRTSADIFPGADAKMEREMETVRLMINLYCRGNHGNRENLCAGCGGLFHYAKKRLEQCPFKENKPQCSKCAVHCYKPSMREKIKAVMKYSGPRMLYRHPILTGKHYLMRNK